MTLKDGNGLVLKEQFIDKSGTTRMYMHLGFQKVPKQR